MTQYTYEMNPVTHITAGAVGEPGQRVFYIQARTQEESITLLAEKLQVQMLAEGIYQLLAEINDKHATSFEDPDAGSFDLELKHPLDPDFRVGRMELAYDPSSDLVELMAYEVEADEAEAEASLDTKAKSVAHLYATRPQMHALADHAMQVVASGRPICLLCGQPDDPQGHVCPRRNGHRSEAAAP